MLTQKVTVKELIPIFTIKDNSEATRIELMKMEENDFDLIVGKRLYTVGEELIYVQPDSNLKEGNEYLDSYIYPLDKDGNLTRNKLGSNNRVKAIGFNFHKGDGKKLFSNGIVVPRTVNVDEFVYKYEEPERVNGKGTESSKSFPAGVYKTDEDNYKNLANSIQYPITLVGTKKIDGSSITIGAKFDGTEFICSRNLEKPLTLKTRVGVSINWFGELIEKLGFKAPKWTQTPFYIQVDSTSEFVVYGKEYLEKLKLAINFFEYKGVLQDGFILRGELHGQTMKGSGNKNNLDSKVPNNIKFFGIDVIEKGIAKKLGVGHLRMLEQHGFPIVPIYFTQTFQSKEELEETCNTILEQEKCEGIVLRTLDSSFSTKFINQEYDSKK